MKKFAIICAASLCTVGAFAETPASQNVECGRSVTITATPKEGFHFVQWSDGSLDATRTITDIKEPMNFTATFAADETIINPSIDPGVDFPVAHGTTLHLNPQTDDECLEFDHWSDITDPTDQNYAVVPRDFEYNGVLPTFTAVFKTKVFNVTVGTATGDETQGEVTISVVMP